MNEARPLLGKRVRVKLDNAVIVTGQLLGFGEGGDFEVLEDDGFVHYCWPMLHIEAAEEYVAPLTGWYEVSWPGK